ncbi:MAG: hypothetical protein M0R74_09470 [Dehalococcoidia bacterium]|nr:hypothetical protein [Dehalococcoidia bacterium]
MERTLEQARARESEVDAAPRSLENPDEAGLLVWVVDMESHRVVRRRVGRHTDRQAAVYSER